MFSKFKKKFNDELLSEEEIKKKFEDAQLEKNDIKAMTIAALITIVPAVLLVLAIIFGIVWILFL